MIAVQTSAPYTHDNTSISRTMIWVMLALTPATAYGFYLFGLPSIILFLITVFSCVLAEAGSLYMAGKPVRVYLADGSAILTGWLLAMTLPPWAPWWIGVLGAFLAIVIGKQVFGGIGQNLFNPAMVARVALLISFPLEMTTWINPHPLFTASTPGFFDSLAIIFSLQSDYDVITSATILGHTKTELSQAHGLTTILGADYNPISFFTGHVAGSLGETSAVLILLGGMVLLLRRIISWHIPLSMMATLAVCATLFNFVDTERYPNALYHLFSGATFLGAFFIATDLVTSPVTRAGQLIFGAGCGVLVFVIRTWAGYPEGMAFAVMLMNGFTPVIDHYVRPRIYGRTSKGDPITYASDYSSETESSND